MADLKPPPVTEFTRRLYSRLPELYRDADAPAPGLTIGDTATSSTVGGGGYGDGTYGSGNYGNPGGGTLVTTPGGTSVDPRTLWPLLRYLSLIGDQAGAVEAVVDRIDFTSPADGGTAEDTSDLVDPDKADRSWLPWFAQLRGARIPYGLTEDDERAIVRAAAGGFDAGSRGALVAAARKALIGSRYVNVIAALDGDRWRIGLSTAAEETPNQAEVVAAIEAAGAKPAGFVLQVTFYSAGWDTIEAVFPTWAAVEAAGSWSKLEATRA